MSVLISLPFLPFGHRHQSGSRRSSGRADIHDFGDLVPRPDDPLPLIILHVLHVLIFPLGPLPNLDFASSADNPDPHRAEQVVRRVTVHVHPAVEHGRRVFAHAALDHGASAGVLLDKVRDVVHHAGNGHQCAAVFRLVDVVVPRHDGEGVERDAPVEFGALLVEFLLLLLDAALVDGVHGKGLEVVGEAEGFPEVDGPFGGVVF